MSLSTVHEPSGSIAITHRISNHFNGSAIAFHQLHQIHLRVLLRHRLLHPLHLRPQRIVRVLPMARTMTKPRFDLSYPILSVIVSLKHKRERVSASPDLLHATTGPQTTL